MSKKNSTIITTVTLTILMTISLLLVISPVQGAIINVDTYLFTMASPDPVGVNQQVYVTFQLDKVSPTRTGLYEGDRFTGFMITVTKPDGTTETKGPYETWSMSGAFMIYTPTMTGDYSFQTSFPGQWVNTTDYDYYFKPSVSAVETITVQEDPVEDYPDVPLPTDPWQRPVYGENKGWYTIADNWLMRRYDRPSRFFSGDTAFAPYTSAPNSAHVLWNKPIIFGGIGGGPSGDKVYYMGLSYEQFYNPLILNGRIIYTDHPPTSYNDMWGGSIDPFGSPPFGTRCLDLYTGEEIWYLEDVNIMFAQLYQIENPNEHGLIAHLWEFVDAGNGMENWNMYDAFTGEYLMSINNVPRPWNTRSEVMIFGENGEILFWEIDAVNDRLFMWNSTKCMQGFFVDVYAYERYNLRPGAIANGLMGIQYNVSIPDVPEGTLLNMLSEEDEILLASWESVTNWSYYSEFPSTIMEFAYDLYTGNQIWAKTRSNIQGRVFYSQNTGDGVYTRFESPILKIFGYDIKTGNQIWETGAITDDGWAYYTYMHHIAYGKLFTQGYDGYLRAWDLADGSLSWEYFFGSAGFETAYNALPSYAGFNIADGKIYLTNDDHSPDSVPWRGGKLWVVDAETGELVWSISGWIRHGAIADGIYTALNSLDGQVYTFGKGLSKTTISAPKVEIIQGQKVVIEGTVTDESPGQPGTPAISDEDMSAWMEYLHMQKPIPTDAKGVEISLDIIDANGNFRNIGTATSDMSGVYSLVWEPDIPGHYTIIATFAGSNSYGSSYAETSIYVEEAPAATPPPDTTPAPPTDTYIMGLGIAILAAVIIIGVVLIMMMRKK